MLFLNPEAEVRFQRVGNEEHPVVIIDNLLKNPDDLVEIAVNSQWEQPQNTYYPGPNAPLPSEFKTIIAGLFREFTKAFNFNPNKKVLIKSFFGLTTLPLEEFDAWQKIPHYDRAEPDHLAMVLYLNHDQTGGTGFFRHLPTNFESISPNRVTEYLEYVTNWIDGGAQLNDYAGENTPDYQMFFKVPFKYNRVAIYPSYVLHCALYDGTNNSADPRKGRLTANTFIIPTE